MVDEMHPNDIRQYKALSECKTMKEILIFLRDIEFYPDVYSSHPEKSEYLKAVINKIDEILEAVS
jgi:hypothetical protein